MEVMVIKNIGVPIPDGLYFKLKMLCLKKNITLKEFIIQLITKTIAEEEDNEK
jgi:hypothetical protein